MPTRDAGRSEDMGVPADQLFANGAQRVGDRESPLVRRDLREEHAFEQQVADFAAECIVVPSIDRVEHLVGLLEDEPAQRLESSARDPTGIRPARAAAP